MGLWPYYFNALLYGDYANEANLHTRTWSTWNSNRFS